MLIGCAAFAVHQIRGLHRRLDAADRGDGRWIWLVFAAGFVFLALDESFPLEEFQHRTERVRVGERAAPELALRRPFVEGKDHEDHELFGGDTLAFHHASRRAVDREISLAQRKGNPVLTRPQRAFRSRCARHASLTFSLTKYENRSCAALPRKPRYVYV